jgi:hypothetical protein
VRKEYLENIDVDVMIILKLFLKRYNGVLWTGLIWLEIGTSAGPL